MIIVLGMSNQEDFHWPEKPLENTQEIDKEAEMKRKFNRKSEARNSVRHTAKLSNVFDNT